MARQRNRPGDEEPKPAEGDAAAEGTDDGVEDEDFQFALKELLAGYEPVLAEELERARDPERLKKDALERPPSCEDEFALADRIFEQLPHGGGRAAAASARGREQLGSVEELALVPPAHPLLHHLRLAALPPAAHVPLRSTTTSTGTGCCVRQALATRPFTSRRPPRSARTSTTLVRALAGAYRPYLTDQLATVDFPHGHPRRDHRRARSTATRAQEEAAAIFERLLTVDVAPALLGRAAFEQHSQRSELLVLPLLVPLRDPVRLLPRACADA